MLFNTLMFYLLLVLSAVFPIAFSLLTFILFLFFWGGGGEAFKLGFTVHFFIRTFSFWAEADCSTYFEDFSLECS